MAVQVGVIQRASDWVQAQPAGRLESVAVQVGVIQRASDWVQDQPAPSQP